MYCHSQYGTILFLNSILQNYFCFFFLLYCGVQPRLQVFFAGILQDCVLSSQYGTILCLKSILQDTFLFLLSYIVRCPYIMCGPLSSQDCKILFLKSILQASFCFFFLLYCVVQPSIKERLRHHSPTPPDNGCNTDISN